MGFRALALFILFCLIQAVQVFAFAGGFAKETAGCGEGCCEAALPGEAASCCQIGETPADDPVPATPMPASHNPSLKTVWLLQKAEVNLPRPARLTKVLPSHGAWHSQTTPAIATVPLTVLHCAFLT